METLHGSESPTCACKINDMEEEDYCSGEEEILPRQNTLSQLVSQRERRLQQIVWFLAVILAVVLLLAAALLVGLLLGLRAEPADTQHSKHSERFSSDSSNEHHKEMEDMNPSAMLTRLTEMNSSLPYLEWESKLGNVHVEGGFNYSHGNLVVPRKGKYRVYLQITYEDDQSESCVKEEMVLVLRNVVFLFSDSYPKDTPLLSSQDTVKCDMHNWSKSLYTAASFELEANSRLWVRSSHPGFIAKNHILTFFGAEFQTGHVSDT